MKEVRHVLWVTPGYTRDTDEPYSFPLLHNFGKAMVEQGIQVHVISLHLPATQEDYSLYGVQVYPVGGNLRRGIRKIGYWFNAWKKARSIMRKHPISVIHSFWLNEAALFGSLVARSYRARHVISLMGQDSLPENGYWRLPLFRKAELVAVSDYQRHVFESHADKKCVATIPWALEPEFKPEKTAERNIDVLGVGSLVPIKQYERFLRVIKSWINQDPELRCVLVGSGPEEQQLKALAQELDISDQLTFLPYQHRDEVLRLMKSSKVFLHTAAHEAYGMVLQEALQSDCHVVSTPVGVAWNNNQIIPIDDVHHIRSLLDQPNVASDPLERNINEVAAAYIKLYFR